MKLASGTTARAVEEWIGKTPDSVVPGHVRIRIFERYGGKCQLTGKRLMAFDWHLDHKKALKDGGQHRESNLWPVWVPKHLEKTGEENSERAAINRKKKNHLLPRAPSKWPKQKFSKPRFDNTRHIDRGE